jgi:hypothetical protein
VVSGRIVGDSEVGRIGNGRSASQLESGLVVGPQFRGLGVKLTVVLSSGGATAQRIQRNGGPSRLIMWGYTRACHPE